MSIKKRINSNKIRSFFKKFAEIQIRYRFLFLLAILIFSAIGMTGIRKVEILSDNKNIIAQTEEHVAKTKEFESLFGNSENIVVLVESSDVFQPEVLKMIKEIGAELLEKVPGASSVTSITDIDITVGTSDGMEIIRPFGDEIPSDKEEIEHLRSLILSRQSLVNKLVSSDCKESWIILSLHPFPEDIEEGAGRVLAPMYKAGGAAIDVVTNPKWQSDKYTIKAAGTPYTEMEERVVVKEETRRTVMVSFCVMALLLIIFTMSFLGTIIPILALIFGIATVFGFMGHLNIVADSNMVSIPILLAMALSVGYSIHLINSFKHYFYKLGKRKEAVIASIEETGSPLFFTVITTVVSVLSFLTTSLYPLRWLGGACAATVFSVYIYAFFLIPIIMSFGKDREPGELSQKKEAKLFNFIDCKFESFAHFVIKRRIPVLFISAILFLSCIPGILKIKIKMDTDTFMGTNVPYIKRMDDIANSRLGSYLNYNVMLSFDEEDSLKKASILNKLAELEDFISGFEDTKRSEGKAKIFSILDIVRETNQTLNEDKKEFYTIPKTQEEIAQMFFLYEISGGNLYEWVDDEYKCTRMRVEVSTFDTEMLTQDIKMIEEKARALFPSASVFLAGSDVDFANINSYIVNGELSSMFASLLAIFILMWIVFSSVKLGLIGLIPNIAPLFAIGAVMGYMNLNLDMVTMTIMPMLLGISVDDTIYFISHAKLEYKKRPNYLDSVLATFKSIGKTLLATSIILCIGFATNAVSMLKGIVRIGLLGALGFFVALIADYFLSPILIYMTRPFKDKKDRQED